MANETRNEDDALGEAVRLTADARVDLRQRIAQVTDDVAQAASHFQGDGGSAFATTMAAWNEAVAKLDRQLGDFEANLAQTKRDTEANDQAQAAAFGNLRTSTL